MFFFVLFLSFQKAQQLADAVNKFVSDIVLLESPFSTILAEYKTKLPKLLDDYLQQTLSSSKKIKVCIFWYQNFEFGIKILNLCSVFVCFLLFVCFVLFALFCLFILFYFISFYFIF